MILGTSHRSVIGAEDTGIEFLAIWHRVYSPSLICWQLLDAWRWGPFIVGLLPDLEPANRRL